MFFHWWSKRQLITIKNINYKKSFRTLRANTTLNKIIVGISLLGEGSVLETCTERRTIFNIFDKIKKRIKCRPTVCRCTVCSSTYRLYLKSSAVHKYSIKTQLKTALVQCYSTGYNSSAIKPEVFTFC